MDDKQIHESIVHETQDPLISILNKVIVLCVKILAILMVLIILWSVVDVIIHIYQQLVVPTVAAFNSDVLITIFGGFLLVLIAIEIFLNIVFYLKKDAIHVPLVLGTALTAVARKVIVLDYNIVQPYQIYAIAASILAVGITYWLITKKTH